MAVRRGLGRRVGADQRVASGPVLDDHGTIPSFAEPLRDQPRHDVRQSRRGEGHDVADDTIRESLGVRPHGREQGGGEGKAVAAGDAHGGREPPRGRVSAPRGAD
jgi:hypothetical protein